MSNPYFNPTGNPAPGASGLSALARAEYAAIAAGFAKLPATLTGNAGKLVVVNSTEDGLTVSPVVYPGAAGPYLPVAGGTVVGAVTLSGGGTGLVVANNVLIGGTLTVSLLVLTNLPTSNAGLSAGQVWNNEGFLCVA